ncbi:spore germination protein [Paenibacillus sp. ACRRX]|uniref:GerAB/ArcD/ProY family transporter n=1 Tax=unclassified Paenibacillus TaxID=185978 RepID=UPI001EF53200|nr:MULTISPECIES: endospore germination permease [unclassified Paenibacillus]MCG7407215.1 spore germination protein [Paenibacillus sp. ACRRX]MDK8180435.1 endospore germination permease [Paenibacillus sp. UMB4589-SE434]
MKRKPVITFLQFSLLIHSMQVGTGILSLPRQLAEVAGTDGWISIILAWMMNVGFGIVMVLVMRQYPNDTLPDLCMRLFGKVIGRVFILLLVIHFVFFSWSVLVNTMLFIQAWFLPSMSMTMIMALFVVPAYMMARHHILAVARYCEFVFFLSLWMGLVFIIPLREGQLIHMLPLIKEGWQPILNAVNTTTFSFIGFEIIFLTYPFLKRKELAIRGVLLGNTFTLLLYVFSTIGCFVYFSPDEITQYNQPFLSLLKVVEFRFLERFDIIFLAMYLFVVSTAWVPYIYSAAYCSSRLLGTSNHSMHVLVFCLASLVLVTITQPSWNQSELWKTWAGYSGLIVAYVLPVLLLLYIKLIQLVPKKEVHT